ncbi:hypothetical protein CFR75_00105 [Komagataeibacter xylinus]|uniref:Uncharacterized protein n=1 Tax=Komagataeibacter xylinus TaxID=28448 RepID=A0A318PLK3_KOMXY|nr:hypothetical protein CXP35_06860 [Komagataeibacter xylinus]PYD58692.1 hypothetical protein CFR75_00105 [Komagataeibacter xylinus]
MIPAGLIRQCYLISRIFPVRLPVRISVHLLVILSGLICLQASGILSRHMIRQKKVIIFQWNIRLLEWMYKK